MSKVGVTLQIGDKEFEAYAEPGALEVKIEHTHNRMTVSVEYEISPEDKEAALAAFFDKPMTPIVLTGKIRGVK